MVGGLTMLQAVIYFFNTIQIQVHKNGWNKNKGPYEVHFICRDSPYGLHFIRRGSPYGVYFNMPTNIMKTLSVTNPFLSN